jgi:hypothetical protein
MTRFSQAKLERRVEVLVTNGQQSAAQAVIAGVGYDPIVLGEGATLLEAARQSRAQKRERLADQKQATRIEREAYLAANREIVSLSETARTLFAADIPTLTALGLLTRYETVTTPDGEDVRVAAQLSDSTAERLLRWRQLLDNAQMLDAALAAQLSAAGWTAERLTQTVALVEAYAAADTAQQAAIQAHQEAAAQLKTAVTALDDWYARAARLIRVAIKDSAPANQAQLRELMGLDL